MDELKETPANSDDEKVKQLAETSPITGNRWDVLARFYKLPYPISSIKSALDIGAGESDFAAWLRGKGVDSYALDIGYSDVAGLRKQRTKNLLAYINSEGDKEILPEDQWFKDPNTLAFESDLHRNLDKYVSGSAHKLPFPNGRFGLVTSFYGIFGVLDRDPTLLSLSVEEVIRVTRRGGEIQIGPFMDRSYFSEEELRNQSSLFEELKKREDLIVRAEETRHEHGPSQVLIIQKI